MNPIDQVFQRLRTNGRKAFIPFITAGDPDLDSTPQLVRELARAGASLIEIGFPYSDPIADGPTIQASYTRALAAGIRLDDIFTAIERLTRDSEFAGLQVPLVAMVSYSIILRRGEGTFLDRAIAAGFGGAIIPDLPVEEAGALLRLAADRDFKLIQLVTPTTPRDRILRIASVSTGFLYYVSIAGITGTRDQLPEKLSTELAWLRSQTRLPVCVGFGISKPEHARLLRPVADGIIVGSAIVRLLNQKPARPFEENMRDICDLCTTLIQALE